MTQPSPELPDPPQPKTGFQKFMEALPESMQGALQSQPIPTERPSVENPVFKDFMEELPVGVQDALGGQVAPTWAEHFPTGPKWCLCEVDSSGFPRVRIFHTLELMLARMTSLEGEEVAAWPFYGMPMRFTKTHAKLGRRFLYLPGEENVVMVVNDPLEPPRIISRDEAEVLELEFQEDGWLGEPWVVEPSPDGPTVLPGPSEEARPVRRKKKRKLPPEEESGDPADM